MVGAGWALTGDAEVDALPPLRGFAPDQLLLGLIVFGGTWCARVLVVLGVGGLVSI